MRTLANFVRLDVEKINFIQKVLPEWRIVHRQDSDLNAHLDKVEIVIGWNNQLGSELLKPQTKLRWVHAWGAGVDTIPLEALKAHRVLLTNSSGVHAFPITESIFGMMLALTRDIHLYVRNRIQGKWERTGSDLELHGKTLGLLGVGAIGEETAKIAKAFGMTVLGVRRSDVVSPYVDEQYDFQALTGVLERSDYIVNTLPLTKETHHVIGREQFAAMKSSAFYINIGRGQTTDSEALIEALQGGRIAGAGLDVFEQEPLPEDNPLWTLDNVIITPHTSGLTEHYGQRAFDIFMGNLQQYVEGKEPGTNRVDLDRGY